MEGVRIRVAWTRAEVNAMREAVDLTPHFEGRLDVRDTLRAALRPGRTPREIIFERGVAERFAARLVALDLATALAKVRLLNAIRSSTAVDSTPAETGTRAA